jgi:hypothetical protein
MWLRKGQPGSVKVRLLLCDEDYLEQLGFAELAKMVRSTKRSVDDFCAAWSKDARVVVEKVEYRSLHPWHGVLLDRELLFLGNCSWNGEKLDMGEGAYREYRRDLSGSDKRQIEMFESWFNRYFTMFRGRQAASHSTVGKSKSKRRPKTARATRRRSKS